MNHNTHNSNDNITPAALLEQLVYVDTFMPEIDDASQLDERLAAELSAFADDSFVFPDEEKPDNSHNDHDLHNNSDAVIDRFNQINNSFSVNSSNNHNSNLGTKTFSTLQQSSFNTGISNILSPLGALNNNNNNSNNNNNTNSNSNNNNNNHNSPHTLSAQSLNPSATTSNTTDLLSNLPKVSVPPGAQSSLIAAGLSQTQIDALAALVAQHQGLDESSSNNNNASKNGLSDNGSPSLNQFSQNQTGIFKASSVNPSITTTLDSKASTPGVSPSLSTYNSSDVSTGRRSSIKIESTGDVDIDKRKRNTAASARFRIKKKMKEQQLERSVRELNELTITLEKKIQTLEMENKLLRNLVVEKGEQRNNDELEQLRKRAKASSTTNPGNTNNFDFNNGHVGGGSNDLGDLVKSEHDFNH